MSSRNWHSIAEHYVRVVREGKCDAAAAIDDIELALLGEADLEKANRRIELGSIELGSWRDSFRWLSDLARYRFVRFVGFSAGRFFVGLLIGSRTPPTEAIRKARVQELIDKDKS